MAAQASGDQRVPPSTAKGRSALASNAASFCISGAPGQVSTGSNAGAFAAAVRSASMSSGNPITTGPGRPLVAV